MACASSRRHRPPHLPPHLFRRGPRTRPLPTDRACSFPCWKSLPSLFSSLLCSACRSQCECYFLRKGCPELPDSQILVRQRTFPSPHPLTSSTTTTWSRPLWAPLTSFPPRLRAYSLCPHTAKVPPASGPLHVLFSQPATISPQILSQLFPFPARESSLPGASLFTGHHHTLTSGQSHPDHCLL